MKLLKIYFKNFLCYKETAVNFPDGKVTNVYGYDDDRDTSNGVGKSALKEGILCAFFGKAKLPLGGLIRKGAKGFELGLTIEVDSKEIVIRRRYNGKITTLDIKVDGAWMKDIKSATQKKKYLEELIGMDYETCVNFSIFDSIRFEDLSSLSSTEIKRLLQLLFNYDRFTNTQTILNEKLQSQTNLLNQLRSRSFHYYSIKRVNIISQSQMKLEHKIKELQSKLQVLNNSKFKLGGEAASLKTTVDKNSTRINWIISKQQCPLCKEPLKNKTSLLNSYQLEINNNLSKMSKFKEAINSIENSISNTATVLNQSNVDLRRVSNLKTKLETVQRTSKDTQLVEAEQLKYKVALNTLKRFESYVLEHYVGYLQQAINSYLAQLTDIQCSISFLDQGSLVTRSINKVVLKIQRANEEFSYMALSTGERMLVAYAFKLAINTLSFKDTFLFIDEGLNKLDKNNRQKLLTMIQNSPFNQIFLVSHDEAFKDLPLIFIHKKGNESVIN